MPQNNEPPARIWLLDYGHEECTWSNDPSPSGEDHGAVEYVRVGSLPQDSEAIETQAEDGATNVAPAEPAMPWEGPQPIAEHAKMWKGRDWVPLDAAISELQFWQKRDWQHSNARWPSASPLPARGAVPLIFYDSPVLKRRLTSLADLIERNPTQSQFSIQNAAKLAEDLRRLTSLFCLPDREAIATAIHDARFRYPSEVWPWEDEDSNGRNYCYGLADAVIKILAPVGEGITAPVRGE